MLSKVDSGDRGKPNSGDGLHIEGNFNQIIEGNVFGNSVNGVFVKGNTNTITKTDAGDRFKGNGADGFHIEGSSNIVDSNVANANGAVAFNFASRGKQQHPEEGREQSERPERDERERGRRVLLRQLHHAGPGHQQEGRRELRRHREPEAVRRGVLRMNTREKAT